MRFFIWLFYAVFVWFDMLWVRESLIEQWYYKVSWYMFTQLGWHILLIAILGLLLFRQKIRFLWVFLPIFLACGFIQVLYGASYEWYIMLPLVFFCISFSLLTDWNR